MPALNRNEKVKCEECGQEYRRADNARHRWLEIEQIGKILIEISKFELKIEKTI